MGVDERKDDGGNSQRDTTPGCLTQKSIEAPAKEQLFGDGSRDGGDGKNHQPLPHPRMLHQKSDDRLRRRVGSENRISEPLGRIDGGKTQNKGRSTRDG